MILVQTQALSIEGLVSFWTCQLSLLYALLDAMVIQMSRAPWLSWRRLTVLAFMIRCGASLDTCRSGDGLSEPSAQTHCDAVAAFHTSDGVWEDYGVRRGGNASGKARGESWGESSDAA